MSFRLTPLLIMLAGACVLAAGGGRAAAASSLCDSTGYAYAGYEGTVTVRGVAATITEIAPTEVGQGQVLAWVGVGSEQGGPGGKPEWIQAGLIAFPGQSARLYYEIARPGLGWKRTLFGSPLTPGESHRIAVVETSRSRWQVSVDGAPASPVIYLPRSHGAWVPDALVESHKDSPGACNSYNFEFRNVSFRPLRAHWRPARATSVYNDHGAKVTKQGGGFNASARL
jgi:hypothetical protein